MCVFSIPPFYSHSGVQCLESTSVIARKEILSNYAPVFNLSTYVIFQLSLVNFVLIIILTKLSFCFSYVNTSFVTNLNSLKLTVGKNRNLFDEVFAWLSCSIFLLVSTENSFDINIALIIDFLTLQSLKINLSVSKNVCKSASLSLSFICYFHISIISVSPESHIFCIFLTDCMCSMLLRNKPIWVPFLLILLSNDVELNPGDHYHENLFSFINWNLNSLPKNNFERVQLLEVHNSLYNYDLISLCETSLSSNNEVPDPLLNDYTFIPANHPSDAPHGGVGLLYRNSLPLKPRPELAFDESIVVELKFGRKKIFFTVLYRSPSQSAAEFQTFINNFEKLHGNIKNENPFAIFSTGDFNGHSQFWWADGDTTPKGKKLDETNKFHS